MGHRIFNAFSTLQADFGTGFTADYGGWTLTSGSADLQFLASQGFYNKYIPGDDYDYLVGNSLLVKSAAIQSDVVIESPFVDGVEGRNYLISVALGSSTDTEAVVSVDYYTSLSDTAPVASTENQTITMDAGKYGRVYQGFTAAASIDTGSPMLMKVKITLSGQSASNLAVGDTLLVYDPIVCEDHYAGYGRLSYLFYTDLPAFMRLDDQNIAEITKSAQIPFPLKRFVESMAQPADDLTDLTVSFQYTRATEGTESKSSLTDPDTAEPIYLFWLASITATTLLSSSAGFTPWIALEANDPISPPSPGEWEDWNAFADWLELQSLNPDFFNTVQGFRDQIRTGFSGISAGRLDIIEEYLRTLLDSSDPANAVVEVVEGAKDNPFRVSLLVDPAVDPDPGGTLITDAANQSLAAGSVAAKVSQVIDSGEAAYDFSKLVYPGTYSTASAGGVVVYGQSFVSDKSNFARHILLNETAASTTIPELGGGIGDAHYSGGSQYYYGDTSASTYGSITSASATIVDLGGSTAGYDLIFVLTDITTVTAALDTAGDGGNTPADWLYRRKHLLACGTDLAGNDNDWAVYLVAGETPGPDLDIRLMLIDGYEAVGATNYAVSGPIDFNRIGATGQYALRVSRSALDTTAVVSFYAQSRLHDDWEANSVGTAVITPTSASATAPGIQILGELNATDNWADAAPVSCALKRVMLFNSPIVFSGTSDTSTTDHAYVDGGAVDDFGMYEYVPTLDVDLSALATYTGEFNAPASDGTTVTMTVNQAATNDFDVLGMRQLAAADVWYFGAAASGGDTLSIDGLSASTAYRVIPTVVDTSDGSTSTASFTDFTTDGSGVLTISAQDDYDGGSALYQGITVTQIDVQPSGGGASVATFLPSTIPSRGIIGADSVTPANTWTLTRNYPGSSTIAYAPSQVVNRDILHAYEGSPYMYNVPRVETYHPFSVLLQVRRFWTTGTYDIFRLENADGQGLCVFYDGRYVSATFTDGINTETVTWLEAPSFGEWHLLTIRRDLVNGLGMVVDAHVSTEVTAATSVVSTFTAVTDTVSFGQGVNGEFNARFGLSAFGYFDRRLSDSEIGLLPLELDVYAHVPFSPLDLSPVLWLDASDTSTISETAGAVDTWSDKSGNGNDVTEATGSYQPTTGASTLNGLNVIDFPSSSLGNASFAVSQPFTVFLVSEPDGNHNSSFLFDEINLTTRVTMNHISGINTVRIDAGTTLDSGVVLSAATATLYRATFNSTSSSIFVDGSSVASGDAGTNDLDSGIRIGSGWNKNNGYPGAIAEIIFVNGTLSAQQISDTEAYLADKWGLTPPPFSPLDLSPAVWLDASDTGTITLASGSSVSNWADKSGNGYDMGQLTAINQPDSGTRTLNSLNVLDFDGSNHFLDGGDVLDLGTNSVSTFAVIQFDTTGQGAPYGKHIAGSTDGRYGLLRDSGLLSSVYDQDVGSTGTATVANTSTAVMLVSTIVDRNGASSTNKIRIDGAEVASKSFTDPGTSWDTNAPWRVGRYGTNTSWDFDGVVAEVVLLSRTATAQEITDTETYLANKWGITL
jgi:hypothetical protein